jgi:hypothetical protein
MWAGIDDLPIELGMWKKTPKKGYVLDVLSIMCREVIVLCCSMGIRSLSLEIP